VAGNSFKISIYVNNFQEDQLSLKDVKPDDEQYSQPEKY
jgi:hypothetical protein